VAPYRPPNLNHFRSDLTGLLAFELGDFRFFGFRGCWGNFFSKLETGIFFLISHIARALVDLRYFVLSIDRRSNGFFATRD